MIDDSINSKVNKMIGSEDQPMQSDVGQTDSVFTGESEQVAGIGSALTSVVGKFAAKQAKQAKVVREARKLQPKIKKISKEDQLKIQDTPDDIANKNQAEQIIDQTTSPIDEVAPTEVTVGVTETATPVAQPRPVDINKKLKQEPIITPEELKAGIEKSKQKLEDLPKVVEGQNLPKELLPPKQVFNLARSGDLAPALDAIADLAKIETKNISYKEIAARLNNKGFDSDFIKQLTGGNVNVSPENSYKVVLAEEWSTKQLTDIGDKVLDGTATNDEYQTAVKAIAFNSLVVRSVKGYQTNVAQSFGILRMKEMAGADFEPMSDIFKSKEDIEKFFKVYKANAKNPAEQRKLVDSAATGKVGGFAGNLISGMVSATGTLGRIVVGDVPRIGLRIAETVGAAGVGSIRVMSGIGSKNKVYAQEAVSQIASLYTGIKYGLGASKFAWQNKTSGIGGMGRAEIQPRPDFFDINASWHPIAKALPMAYNFAASYGGRSVLTVSEFTKGIHYQMGLESLAMRRGLAAQDLAIDLGKTEDEAFDAFTQATRETFENPPDDIVKEAKHWGLETRPDTDTALGTVTQGLDKLASMKNPLGLLIKAKLPFLITPMNDFIQAVERTPAKILYDTPTKIYKALGGAKDYFSDFQKNLEKTKNNILEDINSGDYLKRDLALTRIAIGSGAIAMSSKLALDGNLTGTGPSDKAERERWLAQGALPFSIVEDLSNSKGLSYEERMKIAEAKFGKSNNWSLGTGEYEGKLFRSYSGLSTFGYWLGIGAMYAENVKHLEEGDVLGAAAAASIGMYRVALDQPTLQGVQDLVEGFPKVTASDTAFEDAINNSTSWAVENAYNMIVPASAARKQIKRNFDPTKREYPIDPDLPVGVAGAAAGFQQMMDLSSNSTYGKAKKNIFNEVETYQNTITGMNVSKGKADKAFQIMTLAGANSKKPPRKMQKTFSVDINGETRRIPVSVELAPDEYDKLLEIANQPNKDGFNLKEQIVNLADENHFINGTADGRETAVENIFELAFERARDELYNGDSEQSFAIRRRAEDKVNEIKRKLKRPIRSELNGRLSNK